jgi:hypothetical protein
MPHFLFAAILIFGRIFKVGLIVEGFCFAGSVSDSHHGIRPLRSIFPYAERFTVMDSW